MKNQVTPKKKIDVELSDWENIHVVQREKESGCLPAAIEWMIRYYAYRYNKWLIPEEELEDFQEKYDLEKQGIGNNGIRAILKKIKESYPNIPLEHEYFKDAERKYNTIKHLIEKDMPCVISIYPERVGKAHSVPVIGVDTNRVRFIDLSKTNVDEITKKPIQCRFPKKALIDQHNNIYMPGPQKRIVYIQIN